MEQILHLVRHGRTAANREGRVMGWAEDPLEDDQVAAAEAVAGRLAVEGAPPVRLISSPVWRARQTAAPTASLTGLEVVLDDRVGEMHVGPWQGRTEAEIAAQEPVAWRLWRSAPHQVSVAGRETLAQLYGRVADFLDELARDEPSERGPVVVFTHDAVVRAAVAWAVGAGPESYLRVEVANCSLTTLRLADGVGRLVAANDTCHLRHGSG